MHIFRIVTKWTSSDLVFLLFLAKEPFSLVDFFSSLVSRGGGGFKAINARLNKLD